MITGITPRRVNVSQGKQRALEQNQQILIRGSGQWSKGTREPFDRAVVLCGRGEIHNRAEIFQGDQSTVFDSHTNVPARAVCKVFNFQWFEKLNILGTAPETAPETCCGGFGSEAGGVGADQLFCRPRLLPRETPARLIRRVEFFRRAALLGCNLSLTLRFGETPP